MVLRSGYHREGHWRVAMFWSSRYSVIIVDLLMGALSCWKIQCFGESYLQPTPDYEDMLFEKILDKIF
jgi:hypothetical protein